jgi:hypothetical protein
VTIDHRSGIVREDACAGGAIDTSLDKPIISANQQLC